MLSLLLLLLSQTQVPEASPLMDRPVRTRDMMRAGGRSGVAAPFFQFAPASGAGMGAACACAAVTGAKGEALTFTRASVGECYSNDGQTLTQCGNNLPRVSSGNTTSAKLGMWMENSNTNLLLQSRDFSQAVWTKTNMTCTLTATGMRGAANSASVCTATAPAATVCQTITTAAATRTTSGHIKRVSGTGAVTIARDGVTYGADISARLSSSAWRRAVPYETIGCAGGNCISQAGLVGSVLNPQICIKLATSGDSIALDFWQDEDSPYATSPILTTAASATRQGELGYFTTTAFTPASIMATAYLPHSLFLNSGIISVYQDGSNILTMQATAGAPDNVTHCYVYNSAVFAADLATAPFVPDLFGYGSPFGCNTTAGVHTMRGYGITGTGAASTISATRVYLGSYAAGLAPNGLIRGVCADPGLSRCDSKADYTSGNLPVAWLGDSITWGFGSTTARPPWLLGQAIGREVVNAGQNGDFVAGCLSRWRSYLRGHGYGTLVLSCGINDLGSAVNATTINATLQTIISEAKADGLKVVVTGILPWASAATWSAPKQTETDALNALLSGTAGVTYVDPSSLGTGSPAQLQAGYNSGDGVHPNAAGSTAWAALVQAANP